MPSSAEHSCPVGSSTGSGGRRTSWPATFLLAFVVLGTWALASAPYGVADEPAHVVKAAAVARGDLSTAVQWRTALGARVPATVVSVPRGYVADLGPCDASGAPITCQPRPGRSSGSRVHTVTYVGTYPPVFYLIVGLPSVVLPPDPGLVAMRLVAAAAAAALVTAAWTSLTRSGGGPLALVGLLAAWPPAAMSLAGSVNPSGLELAAAIAAWAAAFEVFGGDVGGPTDDGADASPVSTAAVVRLVTASSLLAWTRPLGPAFALFILGVVAFGAGRRRMLEVLRQPRVRTGLAVTAALLGAAVVYVLAVGAPSALIQDSGPFDPPLQRVRGSLAQTGALWHEAVARTGWRGTSPARAPAWSATLWLGLAAGIVTTGFVRSSARWRVALLGILAAGFFLPVTGALRSPGVTWQGRYALPLLVGLPLLGGLMSDRRRSGRRVERGAAVAAAASLGALGFIGLQAHQARQSRGADRSPFAAMTDTQVAGWWLSPRSLSIVAALVTVALVVAAVRTTRSSAARSSPPQEARPRS
ncbi:MAG: DUF2142 domain-containing protein [Acidimicrobiales bacterium]|nr:DUF2142 domain-containing protein [Acidimicrobiales bacterium]